MLHLENLEEGDYTFTLKVTDVEGQSDTADVHVFVKAGKRHLDASSPGDHNLISSRRAVSRL